MMAKSEESLLFLGFCADISKVSPEIEDSRRYHSSKSKKIGDRVDSKVKLVYGE